MKKILVIVDPQVDFITGSLPVSGAEEAMNRFKKHSIESDFLSEYDKVLVTIDFHPRNHCSFIWSGGMFPPHCVQHTVGATVFEPVLEALSLHPDVRYFTKGETSAIEEFSIFKSPNAKFFLDALDVNEVTDIHVMGIAGDYCVHDTIHDMMSFVPFETNIVVLKDFIASIDNGEKLNNLIKDYSLSTLSYN